MTERAEWSEATMPDQRGISRRSMLAAAGTIAGAGLLGIAAPAAQAAPRAATPWYPSAKFGIFIHWGVYSAPAWGDAKHAAEWYLYAMNVTDPARGLGTREHHLKTYGADFDYDRFIPRFTARRYDPRAWVRLFEQAGARYFVLTSKHHDGFQLFPNPASDRHSVHFGPQRDLVGELFSAARDSHLKRGVYYSLGEFYSPALGTPPRNPYTGAEIPYTGYRPVSDYVTQYEHVHLKTLIDRYDPDVLWADGQGYHEFGGGPIFRPKVWDWRSEEILDYYYRNAANRPVPKSVVANDRFEYAHPDFATVEGDNKTYVLRPDPWEACLNIGKSWGYNENEDPANIKSSARLLQLLVEVVSKNGNMLLNIGPREDGTIADWMSSRLLDMGRWLRINGSAIYDSSPWQRAMDGDVCYTTTRDAFHLIPLRWPGAKLTVPGDVPIDGRARIRLLGGHSGPLAWTRTADGVVVDLPSQRTDDFSEEFPAVLRVSTR
ncbi:alpha-L-fucosidase [Amycolatopsis taiwanensis]|uniref:alpha-L-fucosidase n=1 Tax=Amycolatopsis taiwanensis TaxID=342230 RepID=UPI0004B2688E|nr:alpha-L-fucosidase [Amycolatopsis taiwanensis]